MKKYKDGDSAAQRPLLCLLLFARFFVIFSYVVLDAGFFTTQKSHEVVYNNADLPSSRT
jgi:hypothetical protein